MTLVVFDWLFRFRPIRNFAKQHIVPRAVSHGCRPLTHPPKRLSRSHECCSESNARTPDHRRPLGERGWLRAFYRSRSSTGSPPIVRSAPIAWWLSRGGCAAWYRDIATHYVELFDYYTPDEFRQRSEQRLTDGKAKPRTMSEFDRNTIKLGTTRLAPPAVRPAPPDGGSVVSQVLQSRAAVDTVETLAVFKPLPPRDERARGQAPGRIRGGSLLLQRRLSGYGDKPRIVASLLNALAETTDIVLLNPSMRLDDRVDVPVTARGRIHDISDLMSPRTNLDIQSKVIARARAFVGTHGDSPTCRRSTV